MYNWFTLLYSRNSYSIVNQLYSNFLKKKFLRIPVWLEQKGLGGGDKEEVRPR